ncbi:MAG: C25 family cysteine peptidase [Planctomycetota bacterium]
MYGLSNLRRASLSKFRNALCPNRGAWFVLLVSAAIASAQPQQLPRDNSPSGAGAIRAVSSSARHLTLAVSTPALGVSGILLKESRLDLPLAARGAGQLEVGKPDLPVFGQWVLIPNGATMSLQVDPGQAVIFDGVDVLPVQPPRTDSPGVAEPQFAVDTVTYSTDADYPGIFAYAEPVKSVRGQDCTVVWLYPYQYNPVTRRLSVYKDLVAELDFDGDIRPASPRLEGTQVENILSRLAINADTILPAQRYIAANAAVAPALLSIQTPMTFDRIGNGQTIGCDYLIICDPAFQSAAAALVDWKRLSGFRTRSVTTDETGTTAAEIESYIDRSQKEWFPAPSYILLLGDAEYIPCFYELTHASDEGRTDALKQGKVASDRYYGDTNEDGIADIFVGRLPVDTYEESLMVVNRIIDYERTPPDPPTNADFYTSFAAVAYFDDYAPQDGYADTRFVHTSEDVYLYLNDAGYNGERIYSHDIGVGPTHWSTGFVFENDDGGGQSLPDYLLAPSFEWNTSTANITDAINNGAFLVTYRGHGSRLMRSAPRGWSYLGGWIQPEFQEHDAAALANGSLTPVVFSTTCMTGWFDNETDDERYEMYSDGSVVRMYKSESDDESLCENFITNPSGGAVGVIGSTRVSYSGRNDRLVWGWMDAVWPDFIESHNGSYGDSNPIYRMGPVFEYGKNYMLTKYSYDWDYTKTTIDEFVWFGDPTMEIRTGPPHKLTVADVTHPSAVNAGQLADISVSVHKGADALAGARVTISRAVAPDDYWTDLTDESGDVTFVRFATTQRGDYNIVVTAPNCVPYEETIAAESVSAGALTIERQVSAAEDDGYAGGHSLQNLDADFLVVGSSPDDSPPYRTSGMVFRNVNVPRDAEIISAHLRMRSYDTHLDGVVYGQIEAEAADDADAFTGSRRIDSLPRTDASATWDIDEPWLPDSWYESPDISAVIREVVSRQRWSANNSLAVFLGTRQSGDGNRSFCSFDRGGLHAPRLEITYVVNSTFLVSGRVTSQGLGLPGVQFEGFPESVFADDEGYYSALVHYGWSGRAVPTKAGYVFTPPATEYGNITSDRHRSYAAAVQTYAISGYVLTSSGAGMPGVTVSADNADSTITDSAGYYTLIVPHGWSGLIAPAKSGYDFAGSGRDFASITSDWTKQNHSALTRAISGHVLAVDGSPISGVTVMANDRVTSGVTDSAGYYSLPMPYGWAGRILLTKTGYVFDPEHQDYGNVVDDHVNQNYAATARDQTISGYVRAYDGSGISQVTVSADNGGGSDSTDSSGYYQLTIPYGWSGRVMPARGEYMFTPAYRDYTDVTDDLADHNYFRAQTQTISGYVRADDGSGISQVTVSADNGGGSTVTNSIGYYRLTVLRGWSGRVTPSKPGYSFGPAYREYTGIEYNRTNRNYSGKPSAGS